MQNPGRSPAPGSHSHSHSAEAEPRFPFPVPKKSASVTEGKMTGKAWMETMWAGAFNVATCGRRRLASSSRDDQPSPVFTSLHGEKSQILLQRSQWECVALVSKF